MNEIEILEETKRKIVGFIENDQFLPKELNLIVKEGLTRLTEFYKKEGCYNSTIVEYIEGKKVEMFQYIKQNIHNQRKEKHEDELIRFFSIIEKDIEEGDNLKEKNILKFEIKSNNNEYTARISNMIKDTLLNIMYTQNRILDYNRIPRVKIEKIQSETLPFINSFINKNEEKIYKALSEEDKRLTDIIIEGAKTAIAEIKTKSGNKELNQIFDDILDIAHPTNRGEDFREEQKVPISYEEQRKNAQDIINKNEKDDSDNRRLPDNILE